MLLHFQVRRQTAQRVYCLTDRFLDLFYISKPPVSLTIPAQTQVKRLDSSFYGIQRKLQITASSPAIEYWLRNRKTTKSETCGNDYERLSKSGSTAKNTSSIAFECVIRALAPTRPHCGCRIVGRGVEKNEAIYCCAHCASEAWSNRNGRSSIALCAADVSAPRRISPARGQ